MLICFNCKSDLKDKIDALIAKNTYRDYSEVITVAVENLCLMDKQVALNGTILMIGDSSVSDKPNARQPQKVHMAQRLPVNAPTGSALCRIPSLFLRDGLEVISPVTADRQTSEATERMYTMDQWVFGQYNKLLPAKANCRALLRLCAKYPDGMSLAEVAPRIAEAAADLGEYLLQIDRRNQISRDDALSTAFPRSGADDEKSRTRYANQFVGYVNSQGAPSGLLWDYGLVGFTGLANERLLLTGQGVALARLENPVLDDCQNAPNQKFSEEEVDFLLNHIRTHVPAESFAFRILLQSIADGADNPEKLDRALLHLVPADKTQSLSSSFLASQRSSALSRMADLGVIVRVRQGVRVSYCITEIGQEFFGSK